MCGVSLADSRVVLPNPSAMGHDKIDTGELLSGCGEITEEKL